MGFGVWVGLLAAGVLGGSLSCATLIVRSRAIAITVAGAALATLATIGLVWAIQAGSGRLDAAIAASFLALGAGGGGFALTASLVAPLTRWPRTTALAVGPGAAGSTVHVVLLADCEPERYDPRAVTDALEELDAADAPMPPEIARPLIYAAERSRYRRHGGSPSRAAVRSIAARVSETLEAAGHTATVTPAFCTGEERMAEVAGRLASAGVQRVAIVPLSAAWTRRLEDAVAPVRAREATTAGLRSEIAEPLSTSDAITDALAERVLEAMTPDVGEAGVCLVSEGLPEELAALSRAENEQTTFFVQRVRAALIDRGFTGDLVRQGWLEWQEPDVSEAARHLGAMGAHAIALVPVTYPVETLDTLVELRFVAEHTADETGAPTKALAAWGDDPAVITELADRAIAAIGRLSDAG